ncbi:MAG: BatD family protein, partial [Shewanella sp.]
PEVKVPWWNPHLKRQEMATLPARTIQVKGGAVVDTPIEPNWQANTGTNNEGHWSANLFALLWLVTLIAWVVTFVAWRRALKRQPTVNTPVASQPLALGSGLKGLEQACAKGNVSDILQQLQQYCSEQAARPMTLDKIAAQSSELAEAIRQLQALAYGGKANSDAQLASAVKALLSAVKSGKLHPMTQQSTPLQPLNPNG